MFIGSRGILGWIRSYSGISSPGKPSGFPSKDFRAMLRYKIACFMREISIILTVGRKYPISFSTGSGSLCAATSCPWFSQL
jgi:hypothetical protein